MHSFMSYSWKKMGAHFTGKKVGFFVKSYIKIIMKNNNTFQLHSSLSFNYSCSLLLNIVQPEIWLYYLRLK